MLFLIQSSYKGTESLSVVIEVIKESFISLRCVKLKNKYQLILETNKETVRECHDDESFARFRFKEILDAFFGVDIKHLSLSNEINFVEF